MMIDKLYGKYFQKSRSFLYPALGIKRTNTFIPTGTYISIEGLIEPDEMKLICTFKENFSEEFKTFEEQMLLSNPLFHEKKNVKDLNLYVFNMDIYQSDWFNFILGKYSQLSSVLKRAIKTFYGEKSAEYKFIETYLYPEKHFQNYAKLLGMETSEIKAIGELCDPCNLDKETLKIPIEDLELLSKL